MSSIRRGPCGKGRRLSDDQPTARSQAKSSVRRIKDRITQGIHTGTTPKQRTHVVHPTSIKIDKDNYPGTVRTYAELFAQSSHKPTQSRTSSVEERSRLYRSSVEAKTQEKRAQKLAEEVRECTFTPKVNSTKGPPRTSREFFEDMMQFETRKRDHIHQLRLEAPEIVSSPDFQPTINETSKRIASARHASESQCHERLFDLTKGKFSEYQQGAMQSRQPSRQFIDSNLSRKRVYIPVAQHYPKPAQASKVSNRILIKKFARVFAQARKTVDIDGAGRLNYTRFVQMFDALQFLSSEERNRSTDLELVAELWTTLDSHAYEDLEILMLGLLGYYDPRMSRNPGFALDLKQASSLHQQYKRLATNRSGLTAQTRRGRSLETTESAARLAMQKKQMKSKVTHNISRIPEWIPKNLEKPFDLESLSSIEMDQNLPETSKDSWLMYNRCFRDARTPLRESQEVLVSECNEA